MATSKTNARTSLAQATRATATADAARGAVSAKEAAHPLHEWQRQYGNQALLGLLRASSIQTKLTVNEPGDPYEQEADRVADTVMRMPDPTGGAANVQPAADLPTIQRMCPECEEEMHRTPDDASEQTGSVGAPEMVPEPLHALEAISRDNESDSVRPMCPECEQELHRQPVEEDEEDQVQAKGHGNQLPAIGSALETRIQAQRGTGAQLPSSARAFFEARIESDFSAVRVHADAQAHSLARSVNARAFTLGPDMFFASGEYAPDSNTGRRLLAHELTHVLQQKKGVRVPFASRPPGRRSHEGRAVVPTGRNAFSSALVKRVTEVGIQRATRLTPSLPTLGIAGHQEPLNCLETIESTGRWTSLLGFGVTYEKDNSDPGEITLRQREDADRVLQTQSIPSNPQTGAVRFPDGITIANENHHYELEMTFTNRRGTLHGGLGRNRPAVRFRVCQLDPAPTGDALLFSKAVYAEGVDAGEFPRVRDLVFNRIDWVRQCPGDARDFGTDIRSVLNAPNQFGSVLNNSTKFQQLETELRDRSGPCNYTTPPRRGTTAGVPNRCRLVNAAIEAVAKGDENTHENIFFRSDRTQPSNRAINRSQYPGGNFYWEISGCPPDRRPRQP